MGFDTSGVDKLAADLRRAARQVVDRADEVVADQARALTNGWRRNARRTAGRHGKHYPSSITAERVPHAGGVAYEVGPEAGRKQGSMGTGFEFGSVNQPPHLDGLYATVDQEPKFHAAVEQLGKDLLDL